MEFTIIYILLWLYRSYRIYNLYQWIYEVFVYICVYFVKYLSAYHWIEATSWCTTILLIQLDLINILFKFFFYLCLWGILVSTFSLLVMSFQDFGIWFIMALWNAVEIFSLFLSSHKVSVRLLFLLQMYTRMNLSSHLCPEFTLWESF